MVESCLLFNSVEVAGAKAILRRGIAELHERSAFIVSFSSHRGHFIAWTGGMMSTARWLSHTEMSQTTMRTMYPINHHLDGKTKVNGIGGGAGSSYQTGHENDIK